MPVLPLGNRFTIISYHSISDDVHDELSISPEAFSSQMAWLAASRLPVLSLQSAIEKSRAGNIVDKCIVITFDDGFVDLAENAAPILNKYHFPATVFVVTGRMGQKSDWNRISPARYLLPASDLADLSRKGFFIGSHSHTHKNLPNLSDGEAEDEIKLSQRTLIDSFGIDCLTFAFPYGSSSLRENALLRKYQYKCACLNEGWWGNHARTPIYALNRVEVFRRHSSLEFEGLVQSPFKWPQLKPVLLRWISIGLKK